MPKFGTEKEGFEILVNKNARQIMVQFWGFWKNVSLTDFETEMGRALLEMGGGKWILALNLEKYPPQKEDVYNKLSTVFVELHKKGMTQAAVLITNAITKLQFRPLADSLSQVNWKIIANVIDFNKSLTGFSAV